MNMLPSLLVLVYAFLGLSTGYAGPVKKLIVDTDFFSDVEPAYLKQQSDVSALLLACTLPGADLLAVNINYPSTYSALAVSSVLGHYGHPHVPIGLPRPYNNSTYLDEFVYEHGTTLAWLDVNGTWDPSDLYRKVLSQQPDQSVTIASIGFLNNLSNLLNSTADEYSHLSGPELVAAKVNELVIMGGGYPSGHEFNFWGYSPAATTHVVNAWPGAMVFSGAELGENVFSGARLMVEGPSDDPTRAAYLWYNGYNNSRYSWDPLTVLYAVEGKGGIFEFGNDSGYNHVHPNGTNVWRSNAGQYPQHYLRLAVSSITAGKRLDELYLRGAGMFSASNRGQCNSASLGHSANDDVPAFPAWPISDA
ncbi:Inosine/uridine-preferring nucleoside hydrolase domain-containing protein [Aspergillus floccosus]